jgi:hypothetical protein
MVFQALFPGILWQLSPPVATEFCEGRRPGLMFGAGAITLAIKRLGPFGFAVAARHWDRGRGETA